MNTRKQKVNTNRIQHALGVIGGHWFRDISLLVSLAALGWLCSATASSQSRFAPASERGARAEQSFGLLQPAAQELTLGQGWGAEHPRMLADVNGDKRQDVVGFGRDGVWLATSPTDSFSAASMLADFGYQSGWRVTRHVRMLGDLNGDKLEDLVGFADAGVYRALSTGTGFGGATFGMADFGYNQGWRLERHVRLLADVNGDGRKDIVAFGDEGVWTAVSTDSGFAAAQFVLAEFGYNQGWRARRHPRFVADLNGDGYQDIVGFGEDLIYRALGGPTGFGNVRGVLREFVVDNGHPWRHYPDVLPSVWPRFVGDVNGDGLPDLIAFDKDAIKVACSSDQPPPPPPTAPSSPRITAETTTSLTLAWNDNSNNERRFLVNYGKPGGSVITALLSANTTSFVFRLLDADTNYCFTVQAESQFDVSVETPSVCGRTNREQPAPTPAPLHTTGQRRSHKYSFA
jgi:hypothetical protein